MKFNIHEIAAITGGTAIITGDTNAENSTISRLAIDSRSPMVAPAATMFCALRGATDGHAYIKDIYRRGVRSFMVSHLPAEAELATLPGSAFVLVDNVAGAIDAIAKEHRSQLDKTTFIAITGSVGKTIVKEMLYRTLLPLSKVERSPRSWNSSLGVPLSVCLLGDDDELAIIEAGIDRPGSMDELRDIITPSIGILTPITDEHDSNFKSREEKIAEKLKLFRDCRTVIYAADDQLGDAMVKKSLINATLVAIHGDFNKAAVEATCRLLGKEPCAIDDTQVSNRIDVHEGVNDCLMLCENFTADIASLPQSLDFMSRRATSTRSMTVIMTDLLHGRDTGVDELYRNASRAMIAAGVSRLVAVGPEISAIDPSVFGSIKVEAVASADEFFARYDINSFSSETILIFGRPTELTSRIKSLLESPRHDTTMQIDLDALVANFNYYRSLVSPGTGLVAMVKASAYGHGAIEIAKTLQSQGAAYLAVAVIDEGVELRRGGITMPIMVLNPITGNYKALFDYNLEPSVFSLQELDTLCEAAARAGVDTFKAHIKLDTGMHRVGFTPDETDALATKLATQSRLHVESVFSHLATADCLDKDEYTKMQLDNFVTMSDKIVNALPYKVMRHVLNTAGIMRYPDHHYDMVRLGIGLYGISPLPGETPLQPVASLMSTIIALREWPAGTTIGYGCRGVLRRPSVVATVPIGYADGLNRHLSRGATNFVVKGVECPTVGNICMDQCMIDVTDVPDVAPGDAVEIFGKNMPAERLAAILDTIPYEVVSTVAPRVRRIYFRN